MQLSAGLEQVKTHATYLKLFYGFQILYGQETLLQFHACVLRTIK